MLRNNNKLPLSYSLCTMDVTVYRREGLTRHVLHGVHYEYESELTVRDGRARLHRNFLLVIPGAFSIQPGDKVVLGEGPQVSDWEDLDTAVESLGIVTSVKPRYFMGKPCHVEARG